MARSRMRRMGTAATLASSLVVALMAGASPPAGASAAPPSKLNWSPCYQDRGAEAGVEFECATLHAPLDHATRRGGTIQLAVVRMPATDPDRKIGSIALNPGGPGESGVDFALGFGPFAEFVWGPEVRARFDIVGFDPRGVARSTPVRCFGNLRQAEQAFPPMPFPLTPEEEAAFVESDGLLADQCDKRGSRTVDHVSTANVARDLDLLREALGDDRLTYLGGSYGSYLGVTYANLFPDRVRSVIVDAVLDPIAWANVGGDVPFTTRLRSDEGSQETLERFFELCETAGPGQCALAPDAAARFDAVAEQVKVEPVPAVLPDTGDEVLVTYQELIALTAGGLYDPFIYPLLAELVASVEQQASAADVGTAFARFTSRSGLVNKRGEPHYRNFVEAFPAVACEDSDNPDDYAVWSAEGAAADEEFGYFGRHWTWGSSPCAQWPVTDPGRYQGPYDAHTSNPVLVIGNLYDPATRYEGAQTVRSLLPNSALLTVDMPGHGSLGLSGCAVGLMAEYILDPAAAADIDGVTCPQEFNPFEVAAPATASGRDARMRQQLLPLMAYRPMR